ncbi:MAG: NACHT domain-containing NTPase [Leptolyngbyaceae cyanobacterium]
MGRSRKLTLTDWTAANNALMQYFEGNKSKLAERVKMSRTTITNFFKQEPIGEGSFRKICFDLRLNWQRISDSDVLSKPVVQASFTCLEKRDYLQKIEILTFRTIWFVIKLYIDHQVEISIKPVKRSSRQKIIGQHSQMRLLSGDEIRVDQLYVDVWLLERPEHKRLDSAESLLNNYDIESDRLALGKRGQRNQGLEIANGISKLVILGKPGSGKTTFLKHLAVDWCENKFQTNYIVVLIELRQIREQTWDLIEAIGQELELEREETLILLKLGRLLMLIDVFDEVPTHKLRRNVQNQVKEVSRRYSQYSENRIILTCRTQTIGSIPSGFTSVEVADFRLQQARKFVLNWFMASGKNETEAIDEWIKVECIIIDQPSFKELIATPVLLGLICLVLQDQGEIPRNRRWLYKKGVELLLSRWNDEKDIGDWEVGTEGYRQLSLEDKEALLIEIAARKFDNPQNFVLFEQDELVSQVSAKLELANKQEKIAVLKAIEAQHGLLIERADELWSFSYLTFQEYFTVRQLTQLPPQQLAAKIISTRWQEVVKQLVKSQQPADQLLSLIKQAIDQSTILAPEIQTFLKWLVQKSESVKTPYKHSTIRAFYYSLSLDIDLNLALNLDLSRDYNHARTLERDRALDCAISLARNDDRAIDCALELAHTLDHVDARILARALEFDLEIASVYELTRDLARELTRDCSLDLDLDRDLACALQLARDLEHDNTLNYVLARILSRDDVIQSSSIGYSELKFKVQILHTQLPRLDEREQVLNWWREHGKRWITELQEVMVEHRNIGHDWQFTDEQKQKLQRYYDANEFLVDLLKIRGAVSEKCRTEIEDGLLLPWAELQRRYPQTYGDLE